MQINIGDIAAVVQLIDVVTSRGALRGDELSQVGLLRDKFAEFVKATTQIQSEEAIDTESE